MIVDEGVKRYTQSSLQSRIHLREMAVAQRVPLKGQMEYTYRCNLRCQHCYIPHQRPSSAELTPSEFCGIIDEIVDEGCLWLLFTGGEPFAKKCFLQVYEHAVTKGLLPIIFTNATLITKDIADFLSANPPLRIEVTLYGSSKETYENVTRLQGSFGKCMHGIKLLREREISLKLKTMAMTLTQHEIESMKQLSKQLGVSFKWGALIAPRLNGDKLPVSLRIPPAKVVDLEQNDGLFKEKLEVAMRERDVQHNPRRLYACEAGQLSFVINPCGEVGLCSFAREPAANLRKMNFHTAWRKYVVTVANMEVRTKRKCDNCIIKPLCFSCPGLAKLETGDPEGIIEYACQVAHLRKEFLDGNLKTEGDREELKRDNNLHSRITKEDD